MSDEEQRFTLHMCFETDHEDEICPSLAVVSYLTEVEKWKKDKRGTDETNDEPTPDAEDLESSASVDEGEECPQHPSDELATLMSRFQETMSSYRHLVGFGMIMMPTLRSSFIYREMYKNAGKHLRTLDKDQQYETYGVTEDQYPAVQTQLRHLREFNRGTTVLPGAILLSLVATFDSFIADTLSIMLRHKPERIIDSSKTISVKDILNMSSFDDAISQIAEKEVETLMRGSHDDQIKYIEDKLGISIRLHYDEWGEFIEIFERRNLIAHGNDRINWRYILNCN